MFLLGFFYNFEVERRKPGHEFRTILTSPGIRHNYRQKKIQAYFSDLDFQKESEYDPRKSSRPLEMSDSSHLTVFQSQTNIEA